MRQVPYHIIRRPAIGSTWRKKTAGKQETRRVVDHALGSDQVQYVRQKISQVPIWVPMAEWDAWAVGATSL